MLNKNSLNFLILLLITNRAKHFWIFIISTLLVTLVSSIFFISSSIKKNIDITLDSQADFVLQRFRGGKIVDSPAKWIDEFRKIKGVSAVSGRIYGKYYYEPGEKYFFIVGVDLFDRQIVKSLQKLVDSIDIKKFLSKNNMIIGNGVKELLDYYEYKGYYTFRPPDRSIEKVFIYDTFDETSQIITNDMVIMDIDLARKILGVKDGYFTDIILEVPNPAEIETIRTKLIISHFDMRIIEKTDMKKYYQNLFNYKGGLFLILYTIVLVTFLLILYQRYSMIKHSDAKEIAILRLVGWKINEVIWLKIIENFIIAVTAFMLGVILAYIYVYIFNAPLLKEIFLGFNNLGNSVSFTPDVDIKILGFLFLFFIIPFILAVLIPVWRICITEPQEAMR